jgi:hypothetical protein
VKKVTLSHNFIFGSKNEHQYSTKQVHDIDADQSGWSALCDALPAAPLEELIVADIGMGVTGVTSLTKAISSMAAIKSLTVSSTGNMRDQKSYTLTVGEPAIDLSSKNLGPADVNLLTVWMRRPEVSAALASLTLRGNALTGASQNFGKLGDPWENIDSDMTGFAALCAVLGKLTKVDLSDCHLGPASTAELAKVFSDAKAVLASLTVDGNDLFGTKRYKQEYKHKYLDMKGWMALCKTLKSSNTLVSFSAADIDMNPEAVAMLADAIKAMAVVTSINCLANKFGDEGLATLLKAIEGTSVRSLCGLTEGQTTADFSGQNLGPIDCKIMSAEFEFRGFIAVLAHLDCSQNDAITGKRSRDNDGRSPWIYGEQLEGWIAMCSSLPKSSITSLKFSACQLQPESLTPLADAIKLMAALASVNLSGNRAIRKSRSALQKSVSSRQPTIELIWDKSREISK